MATKARRARTNKFKGESFVHKNRRIPKGGVAEKLFHFDSQLYAYLERLINNPEEPNPFERYLNADLRKGLKDRGYIDLTRPQLLAKRDIYFGEIGAGKPEYNDKELYGVGWLDKDHQIIDASGNVVTFVPVIPGN